MPRRLISKYSLYWPTYGSSTFYTGFTHRRKNIPYELPPSPKTKRVSISLNKRLVRQEKKNTMCFPCQYGHTGMFSFTRTSTSRVLDRPKVKRCFTGWNKLVDQRHQTLVCKVLTPTRTLTRKKCYARTGTPSQTACASRMVRWVWFETTNIAVACHHGPHLR